MAIPAVAKATNVYHSLDRGRSQSPDGMRAPLFSMPCAEISTG